MVFLFTFSISDQYHLGLSPSLSDSLPESQFPIHHGLALYLNFRATLINWERSVVPYKMHWT